MTAFIKARAAIAELLDALRQTNQARMAAEVRTRQPAPRATKLYACGSEWQVLEATRLELGLQLHH